jgi:hypothetical protein
MDNDKRKKVIKKIVIVAVILLIIIPPYYAFFGIGYARKEYKFDRLDDYIWFWNIGNKADEENIFPLEINMKKIPRQYSYVDFKGFQKEPNWYNYYVSCAEIFTPKEYKTLFLYDISVEYPGRDKLFVFTYNQRYDLSEYRDFYIKTSETDVWDKQNSDREGFDLIIIGFYTNRLFAYRLDYLDIAPIKFNNIFKSRIKENFLCKITLKYSLDDEKPITEKYDFRIETKNGEWWNPNAWWWLYWFKK